MPVSEWHGDELRADVIKAAETGLNNAATVLVESVKAKLGARGASYKMLARGRKVLRKYGIARDPASFGKNTRRDYLAAVEERLNATPGYAKVDPPGGYPRSRSGALRAATAFEKTEELRRNVGVTTARSAHKYAGVHEFGSAQIGHPEMNIPARPVWQPSIREEKDAMMEAFVAGAAAEFGGGT